MTNTKQGPLGTSIFSQPARTFQARCVTVAVLCGCCAPCLADGLRLLGNEVTITPSNGWWNSIAYNPEADQYLVLWQKFSNGSNLMGRCLEASTGAFAGPEFTIGSPFGLGAPVYLPDLDCWFVAYATDSDIGGDIISQKIGSGGPIGFPVTLCAAIRTQLAPAVAYDFERHRLLVAWTDYQINAIRSIRGRSFDLNGGTIAGFPELQIGENTPKSQDNVTVAYNSVTDEFLLAWSDLRNDVFRTNPNENNNNYTDVYGQRINAVTGQLIGANIPIDTPYVPGQPYVGDGLDTPGMLAGNTASAGPLLGTYFLPVQQLTGGWTMTGLILDSSGNHYNGMAPLNLSHPLRGAFTGNVYNPLDDTYITSHLDNDYDLTAKLLTSSGQILASQKIVAHPDYEENFGSMAIRSVDGQCLQVTTLFEHFATGAQPKTLVARRFIRDHAGPSPVSSFFAMPGPRVVHLSWTNPATSDFAGTMIRYSTTGFPPGPSAGTLLVDALNTPGSSDTYTHLNGSPASTYHYAAFAHDDLANHVSAAHASATPAPLGDLDADGDVDQGDFGRFQACLSGDAISYPTGCGDADTDLDGDVDATDFSFFLGCMAGAGRPPGC